LTHTDIIGYIATVLTTVANLPQAYKIYKGDIDTAALSKHTYVLLILGVYFWLLYGVLNTLYPVIIANTITLSVLIFILWKISK
jgi:MtN3 and saliva related transmembrane protein